MTDTVRVPRAWLEAFRRDTDPTEPIADNGGTVWDMLCHEAIAMLAASPSVGGWEDISTAPKDGSKIAVRHKDGREMTLSSCPFCGAAPQVCRSKGYAFVQCGKCYAEGPVAREDADHAAAAWNRRTQQAAVSTASQPGTERSGVDQAILPQTEKGS